MRNFQSITVHIMNDNEDGEYSVNRSPETGSWHCYSLRCSGFWKDIANSMRFVSPTLGLHLFADMTKTTEMRSDLHRSLSARVLAVIETASRRT